MTVTSTRQSTQIADCQAKVCSFNHSGKCCTIGINVGGPEPLCDTFFDTKSKGGILGTSATVGACKVQACMHNNQLECEAESIKVVLKNSLAWCGSFLPQT